MIALTTYSHPADFLSRTLTALEQNEAANNLFIGLSLRMKQTGLDLAHLPYFVTVERDGALRLVGLMTTPPMRLNIGAVEAWNGADVEAIVQDMRRRGIETVGVLGQPAIAKAYAEVWSRLSGKPYRPGMSQRVYALRQVEYWPNVSGRFRQIAETDVDVIASWIRAFEREALGGTIPEAEARQWAVRRIQASDLFVWEDGGRVVSMAARARPMTHGVIVNAVYTPPQLRGRGYASACVGHLSQHLLESGYEFCCLFTDLSNATSNNIYQRLGYRPVCDYNEYLF